MRFLFSIILVTLGSTQALALYSSFAPAFRGYPVGGSLQGKLGSDWYMYDQRSTREPWKFGLWSLQAKGAAHGLMDVSLHAYPISFVKISLGMGGTYRYYSSANFDCILYICQGLLTRASVGFSFVMVFGDQDEYLIIPKYQSIAITHGQSGKKIVDESELLLAAAGGDSLEQSSVFFGKHLNKDNIFGLYLKQSQFQGTRQQSEMQLLVMNWDWKKTALSVGVGRYASDIYTPGLTANLEYEWKWGEGLALF